MIEREAHAPAPAGTRPALVGAVLGLAGSVGMLLLMLTGSGREPTPASEVFGRVAIGIAIVAPFVLSLSVARTAAHVRAGVWLGCGIVAVALGVLSFTIAAFVLLPAAILLIVGGSMAMARARPGLAVAIIGLVLLVGVGSFFARSLTTDARCWKLVRTPAGTEWREVQPSGPGLGLTLGPNEVQGTCVSDATTPLESSVILAGWAILALAVVLAARRYIRPEPPPGPSLSGAAG